MAALQGTYESIHKAAQYQNIGAIQTAANMTASDGITMGLHEAPNVHSMTKKVRLLHESIAKISHGASAVNSCARFRFFQAAAQIAKPPAM